MEKKSLLFNMDQFIISFIKKPTISSIWGDIGTGKTTLALQIAKEILTQNHNVEKIFYLNTKKTPQEDLFNRIFKKRRNDLNSFILQWNISTFEEQYDVIMQWIIQIQQLNTFFGENQVKLIIIDEIATQYILSLTSDEKISHIHKKFTTILASLSNICIKFKIPIIILNGFSRNTDEKSGNVIVSATGNKLIEYWTQFDLKIERTAILSRMKFSLLKNLNNLKLPSSWKLNLGDDGFY